MPWCIYFCAHTHSHTPRHFRVPQWVWQIWSRFKWCPAVASQGPQINARRKTLEYIKVTSSSCAPQCAAQTCQQASNPAPASLILIQCIHLARTPARAPTVAKYGIDLIKKWNIASANAQEATGLPRQPRLWHGASCHAAHPKLYRVAWHPCVHEKCLSTGPLILLAAFITYAFSITSALCQAFKARVNRLHCIFKLVCSV